MINYFKSHKKDISFWLILFLVCVLRLYKFGDVPAGLNQDEAFTGYEAFSLLTYGTDSWGYRFPLYFISWASGTSVLYGYLTLPFMFIWGASVWVLRLPQVLLGILSCYVFYRLLRICFNRQTALTGFFLSAVIPWHIMLSRWGLDANISPFFILTGFYFFIRGIKNSKYLLWSALIYGLGMYTYATMWIYIILTFAGELLYFLLYYRTQRALFSVLSAGMIFTLLAFPLLLFILINYGILPEIKTDFLSIPKLIYFRQNEIGFNDWSIKLQALGRILFSGNDFLITTHISHYGVFYPLSLPLIIFGLYCLSKGCIDDIKHKRFSINGIILAHIIIGLIYASTLYPCINRLNFLWFNLLIALTTGIVFFFRYKKFFYSILFIYLGSTVLFCLSYFGQYNHLAAGNFTPDFYPSIQFAENEHHKRNLPITVLEAPSVFPKILYYNQIPSQAFRKTVRWQNFPSSYLDAQSFMHYYFKPEFDYTLLTTDSIYIAPTTQKYWFYQFDVTFFGNYLVAIPKA